MNYPKTNPIKLGLLSFALVLANTGFSLDTSCQKQRAALDQCLAWSESFDYGKVDELNEKYDITDPDGLRDLIDFAANGSDEQKAIVYKMITQESFAQTCEEMDIFRDLIAVPYWYLGNKVLNPYGYRVVSVDVSKLKLKGEEKERYDSYYGGYYHSYNFEKILTAQCNGKCDYRDIHAALLSFSNSLKEEEDEISLFLRKFLMALIDDQLTTEYIGEFAHSIKGGFEAMQIEKCDGECEPFIASGDGRPSATAFSLTIGTLSSLLLKLTCVRAV